MEYFYLNIITLYMKTVYVVCSKLGFIDANFNITFEEGNKRIFNNIGEAMASAAYINDLLGVTTFKIYSIKIKKHD